MRQLKFYGFRKIKIDAIRLNNDPNDIENKYWRFHHEKFQQNRPDLLNDIRRSNQNGENSQDVSDLKSEVQCLKDKVVSMSSDVDRLTTMMEEMMKKESKAVSNSKEELSCGKKRKVNVPPIKVEFDSDQDLLLEDVPSEVPEIMSCDGLGSCSTLPLRTNSRQESFPSLTGSDQDFISDLLDDELDFGDDMVFDAETNSSEGSKQSCESSNLYGGMDPDVAKKLHDTLAVFPKDLQSLFVDRLVATVTNPAAVAAITASAAAEKASALKTNETETKKIEISKQTTPAMTQLAVATLGTVLSQYCALSKRQSSSFRNVSEGGASVVPVHA